MNIMNKKVMVVGLGSTLLLLSSMAQADLEYAKVVSVHPIYTQIQVAHPTEHCYQEAVRDNSGSVGGTIIGGIAGGLLGHTIGRGGGNVAATVGGAVVGGAVGNEVGSQSDGTRIVNRCVTQNDFTYENRITSYDVEYTYNGRLLRTNMPYDPGNEIRIESNVRPVY